MKNLSSNLDKYFLKDVIVTFGANLSRKFNQAAWADIGADVNLMNEKLLQKFNRKNSNSNQKNSFNTSFVWSLPQLKMDLQSKSSSFKKFKLTWSFTSAMEVQFCHGT